MNPRLKFRSEALHAQHRFAMDILKCRPDYGRADGEVRRLLGEIAAARVLQCYLPLLQTLEGLESRFASLRY